MCTIIAKNHLIGKNYDSVVTPGMMFTNKRGLIKNSVVFPPDLPLEWVSAYGSITFSQSGKEMPVSGINETGFVVEQATLLSSVYPEHQGKPVASCLEATQFLLDTCNDVEQALKELNRINITKTSWPIHFALFDMAGDRAVIEYLHGEKKIYRGNMIESIVLDNAEYEQQGCRMDLMSVADTFENLEELRAKDTVWSNVYDLKERKLYLRSTVDVEIMVFQIDQFDFSPQSENLMFDIKGNWREFKIFSEEANQSLINCFFRHPVISQVMNLPQQEMIIDSLVNHLKSYNITNEIMLRFLDGDQIRQLPMKKSHKLYVLKYLASKFEIGKEYTEGQVNSIIDDWHTFGDYFVLRRELIENQLLKRLPNGSKYWRE